MMKEIFLAFGAFVLSAAAFAQQALPQVEAEVRRVDAAQQKITLRHGEIPNLQMSAMTMVFRVKDPALLQKVKPGDAVRFTADKAEDGALVLRSLELKN